MHPQKHVYSLFLKYMACNVFSFVLIITNEAALPHVSYYTCEQISAFMQLGQEVKGHMPVFFLYCFGHDKGLEDLSSLTRDWTLTPWSESAES